MADIARQTYQLSIDPETGWVRHLDFLPATPAGPETTGTGIAQAFCQPFVNGAGDQIAAVSCGRTDEGSYQSWTGATRMDYRFFDRHFTLQAVLPTRAGPRSGLRMDLNFLDANPSVPREHQFMPHVLYTSEDLEFAFFVFRRVDGRHVWLALDGHFAAWRFRYSYSGHRILGMDVLSGADDVATPEGTRLSPRAELNLAVGLEETLEAALAQLTKVLGIVVPWADVAGGPVGTGLELSLIGEPEARAACRLHWLDPDGTSIEGDPKAPLVFPLVKPGIHRLELGLPGGRTFVGRFLGLERWEDLFRRVTEFHRQHFQLPSGAFARVISRPGLVPDGVTMEGVAFGDDRLQMSCRTGEFGGFAAWAMVKTLGLWGSEPTLDAAVRRYFGWALNFHDPDHPRFGTVSWQPQHYRGRDYSAGHLFQELNYPQYEIFLVEQLTDWYVVTGEEAYLDQAVRLARHFVTDHVGAEGAVWCQNAAEDPPIDYCSVHVPMMAFVRLHRCLEASQPSSAREFLTVAERMADHIARRGIDFPTEGEPCTEDGSMNCSTITLLTAWLEIEPKPEYLALARQIQALHESLTLRGPDVRLHGSSLRFWETQYETDDWGPSLNAGHAWTMWMVEAHFLMARATGSYASVLAAWAGTLCVASKTTPEGALPSCFTPDLIPGVPHHPYFLLFKNGVTPEMANSTEVKGGAEAVLSDARLTTQTLAMDYPRRTYAASGNYLLVKAAEIWDHAAGYSPARGHVNGTLRNGVFHALGSRLTRLFVRDPLQRPLRIAVTVGDPVEIVLDDEGVSAGRLTCHGGQLVPTDRSHTFRVMPRADQIVLARSYDRGVA